MAGEVFPIETLLSIFPGYLSTFLSVKLHFLSSQFVPTAELLSCTKFYFSIISALAGPSHHGPSCSWCRWSPMSPVELSNFAKFPQYYLFISAFTLKNLLRPILWLRHYESTLRLSTNLITDLSMMIFADKCPHFSWAQHVSMHVYNLEGPSSNNVKISRNCQLKSPDSTPLPNL